jgi:hypothetical protein
MKLKPQIAVLAVLVIFAAGILITNAAGLWSTTTTKTPSKIASLEAADAYDPNDIRGSFTFGDISGLYGVPLEDLAAAFGVDEKAAAGFKCKDLETLAEDTDYEIGTASVRMFTAYYQGLPYTPTEETYLSAAAAAILAGQGHMTPEQSEYLAAHTVPAA